MNSLCICSCSVLQLATQGTTISAVHKWQPLGSTDGSEMWWQCIPCIQGTWHPPQDSPQLDEALEYKEQVCSSHQENRLMLESALLTEHWTVLRSNSENFSICKGSRKPLQYFLGLSKVSVKTSTVTKLVWMLFAFAIHFIALFCNAPLVSVMNFVLIVSR